MAFPYILCFGHCCGIRPWTNECSLRLLNIPSREIFVVTIGIVHREFVDAARLSGMNNTKIIITEHYQMSFQLSIACLDSGWMILETAG